MPMPTSMMQLVNPFLRPTSAAELLARVIVHAPQVEPEKTPCPFEKSEDGDPTDDDSRALDV